jgi:hypothetical protein
MSYSLTASQAGPANLPPVTVTIDGKSYQTNPLTVNILKPDATDSLDLDVALSENQCYLGQPVIMTVKFYISADIGDFQFDIPVFSSNDFYLEDPDVINPQAKQFRLSPSLQEPAYVTQSRALHNGRDAVLLSFSKVLIPRRTGSIVLGSASVSADVAVGQKRSRDPFFEDFFGSQKTYKRFMVTSQPLTLTVLPLPQENKPAQFYGLVGRYTISASASPAKVSVGDPITLTIKIGGSKYLKPVQWPALEQVPQLAANFKIPEQKSTPALEGDYKVFTQTIRANNDKVTAIPPIPLAFFDPDKGSYVTAETDPIKLDVSPTKILTNADLQGLDFTPVSTEVEAIKKGLSANYEGADVLRDMSFSPFAAAVSPAYMFIWLVPFAALVISGSVKILTHTTPEKIAAKRRRLARSKAVGQLRKISSASQQCHELLVSAMKQYIGQRFDKVAGSLTADDCYQIILAETNDAQTADRYKNIIAQCESACYAPVDVKIEPPLIKKVIDLIRNIDKNAKNNR